MSITSLSFLFIFLPVALVLYYVVPGFIREYILLAVNLLFYALCSTRYIFIFAAAILFTVICGRGISRTANKKAKFVLLVIGILINVSLLAYYKYYDFAVVTWNDLTSSQLQTKGLLLPLGISFFTFKSISYLVDNYRGAAKLSGNPVHDCVYLSFFAQIQSGPLSRYNEMAPDNRKSFDIRLFSDGIYRFMIGFTKKVLIANVLSNVTLEVFSTPFEKYSMSYAWLGSICFSLQLFFDFAGYSDMAIGISQMFGYKCRENFNYPYMTDSVSRFWKRWHISLSEWFRDYVYIPLGGSRNKNRFRIFFNLFVVWILTGIWHGAAWNFVAWGLGYFIVISFEKITGLPEKINSLPGRIVYRVAALLFINFQWVIFNSDGLINALRFVKKMIIPGFNRLADIRTVFLLKNYGVFIGMAVILSFPIVPWLRSRFEYGKRGYIAFNVISALIIAAAFAFSVSFIVAGQNNPFAYANF